MKIGPKYKICRRLGDNVFPQCQTTKFAISGSSSSSKRGDTGKKRGRAASEYGLQLIEKQKARYTYGLTEKQFRNYVIKAQNKVKTGSPSPVLHQSLEQRLDNVVFRAGIATSRAAARQMVSHGHFVVDGVRVTIPSFSVLPGNVVAIRKASLIKPIFNNLDERLKDYQTPNWLVWNPSEKTITVKAVPVVAELEVNLNFPAIIEFYSRV